MSYTQKTPTWSEIPEKHRATVHLVHLLDGKTPSTWPAPWLPSDDTGSTQCRPGPQKHRLHVDTAQVLWTRSSRPGLVGRATEVGELGGTDLACDNGYRLMSLMQNESHIQWNLATSTFKGEKWKKARQGVWLNQPWKNRGKHREVQQRGWLPSEPPLYSLYPRHT